MEDISALKTPYCGNASGKNDDFVPQSITLFPCAVEISFLHTKVCGNDPFLIEKKV